MILPAISYAGGGFWLHSIYAKNYPLRGDTLNECVKLSKGIFYIKYYNN